ncbi:MAG: LytTR family DNA-binding domain-containing protein [Bacteroidales bacterium]|nr:LytTR family DNA-binding domain-containing protein [Bacteroidales bacterium]
MYNVLIVDDEFLARKLLQGYVEKIPELTLVGSCSNAFEALRIINSETQVDILLLDIHMPDLNGLDFARTLKTVPAIIFTTAYSEYALESYEVSAADYLLKPIAMPRFLQAIDKAKQRVDALGIKQQPPVAADDDDDDEPFDGTPQSVPSVSRDFLIVKADYKLYKINYSDLLYIEGQHEYVSFYTTGKRITALYSLKALEENLPADKFVRVHKSYIVSIANIQEIEQVSVTVAGNKIPIGNKYKENLESRLGLR